MNQKFNIISIILVVILVGLLIYVMASYYTKSNPVSSDGPLNMIETDILVTSGDENAIMSNYVGSEASGDKIIPNSGNEEEITTSGEGVIDVIYNEDPKTPAKTDDKLIITSDENISDKEKKQVLHELDQTLMDLLDVVDKVQTVDESRLGEESEVQP